ncbi:MAG: cytochrome P450 [Polyangiales bacterium]
MRAPGPSTLQFIGGVRKHGFLDYVGQLWHAHGDTFQVRLAGRTLMFAIHPVALEQITISGRAKYDKRASFEPVRKYLTGEGLVASTGELWRRQRRLMSPFFTPKGIRSYADTMIHDALRMQARWEVLARAGNEVEIAEEMTIVTASIILKALFSADTMESIDRMRHAVETMIGFVTQRATGIPVPAWIPTPGNRRYKAAQHMVHRSIEALIADRRKVGRDAWPDDLLTRLMSTRDEETGQMMSDTLLRDEAITMFFAGHETTARTLTFAWYALASNPHVAAKLHAELDQVLGQRAPTVDELKQLPYTLQVVKEVMRLYPPAPFYSRDAIETDRLGGFDVEPGTIMLLSPYYSHRHPAYWEEPERFDPDRWTREREMYSPAYHPFGSGQRVCIGNSFSLLESHLLLAILAQRFAPKLRPGYQARWDMRGVLSLTNGLPMTIELR